VKSVCSRFFRRLAAGVLVVTVAVGAALLIGGAANAQSVTSGSFSFSGDQGDYISGGGSYNYSTTANDSLNVTSDGDHIQVGVTGVNGDWWSLDLAAPSDQTLAPGLVPGTYSGTTRYPFQALTVPGLDLSGNGRGCNTLIGSFTIQNVVFGPYNYVQELDATFEQHCEGGAPALRGQVHIANAPPPSPSPPPSPFPDGTLVFKYDRGGFFSYSTAVNDRMNLASDGNHINVSVNGANGDWWFLDLAAPSGQTLAPGTYSGATRYPFQAPTEPGLSLSGNGSGCNTLTGFFTIQNVVFGSGNDLQELDATFEQHCEGGAAAVRGKVHFANSPSPSPSPSPTPTPGGTATTATLKAFPNPAFQGLPVIFLVNVAPSNAAGTVQFRDGITALGAPVPVTAGFAFLISPSTLTTGPHSLTAVFTPTNPVAFGPSTSPPVTLTVRSIFS
jgi:hypothetical protein